MIDWEKSKVNLFALTKTKYFSLLVYSCNLFSYRLKDYINGSYMIALAFI